MALDGPLKSNCVVSVWSIKGRALGTWLKLDHFDCSNWRASLEFFWTISAPWCPHWLLHFISSPFGYKAIVLSGITLSPGLVRRSWSGLIRVLQAPLSLVMCKRLCPLIGINHSSKCLRFPPKPTLLSVLMLYAPLLPKDSLYLWPHLSFPHDIPSSSTSQNRTCWGGSKVARRTDSGDGGQVLANTLSPPSHCSHP